MTRTREIDLQSIKSISKIADNKQTIEFDETMDTSERLTRKIAFSHLNLFRSRIRSPAPLPCRKFSAGHVMQLKKLSNAKLSSDWSTIPKFLSRRWKFICRYFTSRNEFFFSFSHVQ